MSRLLLLLVALTATLIYLVRCLTQPRYAGIVASTATAGQQIQQHRQETSTLAHRFELTVMAVPSGKPLSGALVECAFFESKLQPASARADGAGMASIILDSDGIELGCPINIRVTDAAGRRAFSGVAFLDHSIILTVDDLATIDIVHDPAADMVPYVITMNSDPPAGISVPQFLDRFEVPPVNGAMISGYWSGAKKLHYSFEFGRGTVNSSLVLDESGSGMLPLPGRGESLVVRIEGGGGPVANAEVQIRTQTGNASHASTATTDSSGSCCHLLPWDHWDSARLRVTCNGYCPYERVLGVVTKVQEEVLCQMIACDATARAAGQVVGENGMGIPGARVIAWRRHSGLEAVPDSITLTDGDGLWQLPIFDSDDVWIRMERFAHVVAEIPWIRTPSGVKTVMKTACAVVVAPYGAVNNPVYTGLPIRYILYDLDNNTYVVAHAGSAFAFPYVPSGRYCVNVMVGRGVAYGRTMFEVHDERSMEVAVPCIDPGIFRIVVANCAARDIDSPLVIADGLPSDIADRWSGSHEFVTESNDTEVRVCAFGMQHGMVVIRGRGRRQMVEAHVGHHSTIVW